MAERPRVGVGVIVERVIEGEVRVLLMRRRGPTGTGTWCNPGGHLEGGERIEACAAREVLEETGVTIGDVAFHAVTNDIFPDTNQHYVTLWVRAAYASGEPTPNVREATEAGWFAPAALPSPRFLPLENLLAGRCYPPR